jgi:PAS domain S-box-containing protein
MRHHHIALIAAIVLLCSISLSSSEQVAEDSSSPATTQMETVGARPHLIGAVVAGGVALLAIVLLISMWGKVDRKTRELRESEQRFRNLLETVQLVAVTLDAKGRVTFINDYALTLAGYQRHDVLGKDWFELFVPRDTPGREELRASVGTESFPAHNDGIFLVRGGGRRLIAWSNTIVRDIQGNVVGVAGIGEDITERRQAQEALAMSLKEKEVLLKEVYHRVKNNLQIISALLRMQTRRVTDRHAVEALENSISRVMAMSMVHEKLYQAQNLVSIDFLSFAQSLVGFLNQLTIGGKSSVFVEVSGASLALSIDQAIPLGLVLNELVTNSLKYAFPEGRTGRVSIRILSDAPTAARVIVADDGVGLPPGVDLEKVTGLGFRIVRMLVDQLHGSFQIEPRGGMRVTVHVPLPEERAGRVMPA